MHQTKVLRSGRPEDIERSFHKQKFSKEVTPLLITATAIFCCMIWPVIYRPEQHPHAGRSILVFCLGVYGLLVAIVIASYTGNKEPTYFLADVPDIQGWKWAGRILWCSPLLPAMLFSRWQMHRMEQLLKEQVCQDRAKREEFLTQKRQSTTDKEAGLLAYCQTDWQRETVRLRREVWTPKEHQLTQQIRQHEEAIAAARQELSAIQQLLKQYPENATPSAEEQSELAQIPTRLREIPEICQFSARMQNGVPSVHVAIQATQTVGAATYDLGLYGLSFEQGYCSCVCLASGRTELGHQRFSHFDTESFCQDLAEVAVRRARVERPNQPVAIDQVIIQLLDMIHLYKVNGIDDRDLHYYFQEL